MLIPMRYECSPSSRTMTSCEYCSFYQNLKTRSSLKGTLDARGCAKMSATLASPHFPWKRIGKRYPSFPGHPASCACVIRRGESSGAYTANHYSPTSFDFCSSFPRTYTYSVHSNPRSNGIPFHSISSLSPGGEF